MPPRRTEAGGRILMALYGGDYGQSPTALRYLKFVSKTAGLNLAMLPGHDVNGSDLESL